MFTTWILNGPSIQKLVLAWFETHKLMKCSQTKFSLWNLYNNHHFAQLLTNAQVKEANVDLDVVEPEVQDFSVFRGNSGVSSFLIGVFL